MEFKNIQWNGLNGGAVFQFFLKQPKYVSQVFTDKETKIQNLYIYYEKDGIHSHTILLKFNYIVEFFDDVIFLSKKEYKQFCNAHSK